MLKDLNSYYTTCDYHPNKMAVTTCERCRRPICLEDKRIYRKRHRRSHGKYSTTYYTSHEYCVLCNASQLRSDANPLGFLIFIPFLVFFFIIFGGAAGAAGGVGPFFTIFILFFLFIIVSAVFSTIRAREKAEQAENEAMNFKATLYSTNDATSRPSFNYYKTSPVPDSYDNPYFQKSNKEIKKAPDLFSIVCYECGANINLEDKFCQNCGDSTKEEIKDFNFQSR